MKIELANEGSIVVLIVKEAVSAHEVQVLRAGVNKILGSGKNRIVIDFQTTQTLPSEVLREVASLDLLARELSGRVVLCGVTSEVKSQIESFAKPPVITCFLTRAEALQYFHTEKGQSREIDTSPKTPLKPVANKEEALKQEQGELGNIRAELAKYKAENATLVAQLKAMAVSRKSLPDEVSYQKKIDSLEDQVLKLSSELDQVKQAAQKK